MLLLILAIAPGIAICLYILTKDQYNKEPRRHLVISFALGVLSAVPAALFETLFGLNHLFQTSILAAALMAYPVVAFAEEGSKYFMVRRYAYRKPEFDEPLDGIVYAIMVGMGFATIENIFYVMEFGFGVAIMRALLSVPAHATFAVIMGYYMGEAKFASTPAQKNLLLIKAVLYPIFWHGTFDFFLFLQENQLVTSVVSEWLLVLGSVASFIYAIVLSRKAIREHVAVSKTMHGTIMHRLHCEDPWFTLIKNGVKPVEGRKNSPKYATWKTGDKLVFALGEQEFVTTITKISKYKTLEDYLEGETLARALPGVLTLEEGVNIYLQWSTREEIEENGFLGIEVSLQSTQK